MITKKILHYHIVAGLSPIELQEEVNGHLNAGYSLHGTQFTYIKKLDNGDELLYMA